MKRSIFKVLIIPALVVSFLLPHSVSYANNLKIGVLDMQALENVPQAVQIKKRLTEFAKPKEEKFKSEQQKVREKIDAYERDKDILSEKDALAREQEIKKMDNALALLGEEFEANIDAKKREELTKFNALVEDIVNKIAKQEKYDVILNKHATPFYTQEVDFTKKVVAELEKAAKN